MKNVIYIILILLFVLTACQKENSVQPFNYERDTPAWLKVKIDSMATAPDYIGTVVYRYELHKQFIYHIMFPISSCAYCELYLHDGSKVQLSENLLSDFLQNRTNEIIIWAR
ncbi:MAG: hypothetical protein M0P61_14645 [Ignavibacteriaceae bacterium]|nr:hypothetical protein [Ignavibacteriaceae bacterium]